MNNEWVVSYELQSYREKHVDWSSPGGTTLLIGGDIWDVDHNEKRTTELLKRGGITEYGTLELIYDTL